MRWRCQDTSYPGQCSYLKRYEVTASSYLDTSYLLTWHFVPSHESLRTFSRDTSYLSTNSGFLHRLWWFCALWSDDYDYEIKANQTNCYYLLLLFCWDQGAILTIAWLFDFNLKFKIFVQNIGGRCCPLR